MTFFYRIQYLVLFFIGMSALFSCSSRDTPAPVSTLYGNSVLSERNRDEIKTTQYSVKKGDTLYSIAWRANSDVRNIAKLNNLTSPYRIYPSQNLFLVDTIVS